MSTREEEDYELGYEEGQRRAERALAEDITIGSEIEGYLDIASDYLMMSEEYCRGVEDGFHDYIKEHG